MCSVLDGKLTRQTLLALTRRLGSQIRMVAGTCNHPNCLVLPFSLELIRLEA